MWILTHVIASHQTLYIRHERTETVRTMQLYKIFIHRTIQTRTRVGIKLSFNLVHPMLLVHSPIPWSRFIPEKPDVPVCSSWNPQAKRVPSLEGRNTLRISETNPQENFWT